jgi:hypothetical protein|tara:strand:- start:80 stop:652 length:573 start_codon:yes stop_codon:yes gene_type:complete
MARKFKGGNIFLKNKIVLYLFLFIALIDTYNHLLNNDTKTLFLLVLAGYVTSFFTDNMTIILVIALVVSNIYKNGIKYYESFKAGDIPINDVPIEEAFESGSGDKSPLDEEDMDPEDMKEGGLDTFDNKDTKQQLEDAEKLAGLQDKMLNNLKELTPLVKEMEGFASNLSKGKSAKDIEKVIKALEKAKK